jgi:hypothetical protein
MSNQSNWYQFSSSSKQMYISSKGEFIHEFGDHLVRAFILHLTPDRNENLQEKLISEPAK